MTEHSTIKIISVALSGIVVGFLCIYFSLNGWGQDAGAENVAAEKFYQDASEVAASSTVSYSEIATSTVASTSVSVVDENIKPKPALKVEVFKLQVPYFHQQFKNSCEAASLRMALGYYGIQTNDMLLVNDFGYNPRAKDVINNIWDDPQKMYVGFVDLASSTAGYGVYGIPVARAAELFERTTEYKTSITPQELAAEIKAGYPVIMWGYTSLSQTPYTWNTPDGGTVRAFHGEHVRLVVGFSGSADNPAGFYVHDPMVGPYQYWSSTSLMRQFNSVLGVTNQVVVVK